MHGKPHYLEIVTPEVDAVCTLHAETAGVTFDEPVPELGGARVAVLPDGGLLGVRGPLREDEGPLCRIYFLVDDLDSAVAAARKAGAEVALGDMRLGNRGRIAIVICGGVEQGFWQPREPREFETTCGPETT